MTTQSTDELVRKLDEEWLQKSRSSFDCQECGITANLISEIRDTIERLQRELSELQQYGVVVPVNPTAEIRDAMSSAYDRRLQFIDRWDRVYNAALNGAIDAARKQP